MPTTDNLYRNRIKRGVNSDQRAILAYRRIQDKPTTITLWREEAEMDPQIVRIEWRTIVNDRNDDVSESTYRELTIFGVRDHDTVDDTDIKNGDLFVLYGDTYEVQDVAEYTGSVKARGIRSDGRASDDD